MPRLKNRQVSIPGGLKYYDARLRWEAAKNVGSQPSFDTLVNAVISVRKANRLSGVSTDYNAVADEVDEFNATLCDKMGWHDYIIGATTRGTSMPPFNPQPLSRLGAPARVAGGGSPVAIPKDSPFLKPYEAPKVSGAIKDAVSSVKKLAAGAATLLDWEEQQMPHVPQELAEKRASVCAVCPKNIQGKHLSEYFTAPAAAMIKERLERMKQLDLHTSHDEKLQTCDACLCQMRLKVWFPMALVLKRLTKERRAELNQDSPRCWQLTESE